MRNPRAVITIAALFGAAGVALLAAGSHRVSPFATTAGQMLLFHAPALIASALARRAGWLHERTSLVAMTALTAGVAIFSGDLTARTFLEWPRLFPMAAPIGGSLLIVGWLALALAAMLARENAPQ